MASLNEDCLLQILSYIEDYCSFYYFALTCRRFFQVSLSTKDWHPKVMKRKMKFYVLRFIFEFESEEKHRFNFRSIQELVRVSETYKAVQPTYANILKVWKTRGPVAAEMLTWIKDVRVERTRRSAQPNEETQVTLFLPKHNQKLTLRITVTSPISDRVEVMSACVLFDGSKMYKQLFLKSMKSFVYSREDLSLEARKLAKEIMTLFQDELGETNTPLTEDVFLWFCFCYEDTLTIVSDEERDEKIYFTDNERNLEPNNDSIQLACPVELSNSCGLLKKTGKPPKQQYCMEKIAKSCHVKKVVDTFKTLKQVIQTADAFISDSENSEILEYYMLKKHLSKNNVKDFWSDEALLDLTLRMTTLQVYLNEYSTENYMNIRIQSDNVIKFKGTIEKANLEMSLRGNENMFHLKFLLPDGSSLDLHADHPLNMIGDDLEYSPDVERFGPVAQLLKGFLDKSDLQRGKNIKRHQSFISKLRRKRTDTHYINKAFFHFFIEQCYSKMYVN